MVNAMFFKRKNMLAALAGLVMFGFGTLGAVAQTPETPPPAAGAPAAEPPAAATAAPAEAPKVNEEVVKEAQEELEDLNVLTMFSHADIVVKIVMMGLILASVWSWALLILKFLDFGSLRKSSSSFESEFRKAGSLAEMGEKARKPMYREDPKAQMALAAVDEMERTRQAGIPISDHTRAHLLERVTAAVDGQQATLSTRLSKGLQFLASTASSGPFIGLFGTVYGIMNSFIGIAKSNTTNLAVVAPGIAEALLATGIGLFAAIPAAIFYNIFQRQIATYGTGTEQFKSELMNAISRNLDRGN